LILNIIIHTADIQDRDGGREVVPRNIREVYPRLRKILADQGYRGSFVEYIKEIEGLEVEISQHEDSNRSGKWVTPDQEPGPKKKGFRVLKMRWIVERTHAWLSRQRRLSKDYESTTESSTAWIYIAMSFVMLRRLTKLAPR
jgi:hypothetical protein